MIAGLLCDSLLAVCRGCTPVGAEVVDARQPGGSLDNGQDQVCVIVVGDALQHRHMLETVALGAQQPAEQLLLHM
jgi:hypothetical protein